MPEPRVAVKVSRVVRIMDDKDRIAYEIAEDGEGNVSIKKTPNAAKIRLTDLADAVGQLKKRDA